MFFQKYIKNKLSLFLQLCKTNQVKALYVFGSSITNSFDENSSDIDILIEMNDLEPLQKGEHLLSLWDQLEIFFQRRVDLLTTSSLKNPILKKNIDDTKLLIYDGKREKICI